MMIKHLIANVQKRQARIMEKLGIKLMSLSEAYDVMSLPATVSLDELKNRHRELVRKYHPDINKEQGSGDKMKKINEAWERIKLNLEGGDIGGFKEESRPEPEKKMSLEEAYAFFGVKRGVSLDDFRQAMRAKVFANDPNYNPHHKRDRKIIEQAHGLISEDFKNNPGGIRNEKASEKGPAPKEESTLDRAFAILRVSKDVTMEELMAKLKQGLDTLLYLGLSYDEIAVKRNRLERAFNIIKNYINESKGKNEAKPKKGPETDFEFASRINNMFNSSKKKI